MYSMVSQSCRAITRIGLRHAVVSAGHQLGGNRLLCQLWVNNLRYLLSIKIIVTLIMQTFTVHLMLPWQNCLRNVCSDQLK